MDECLIFDHEKELSKTAQPTYDVMKCYQNIKNQPKPDSAVKEPSVSEISEILVVKI